MIAIIADTITMISDHAKFSPQHDDVGIYRPKIPKASGYYRCVQEHFEQLQMHWQDCYAPRYGFWRSYVTDVIYRYLECGDLHFGFAWVRCQECGHEYRLAYSCKRRHFCPSCRQKRPAMSDVRIWVSAEPRRILSLFGIHPWGRHSGLLDLYFDIFRNMIDSADATVYIPGHERRPSRQMFE